MAGKVKATINMGTGNVIYMDDDLVWHKRLGGSIADLAARQANMHMALAGPPKPSDGEPGYATAAEIARQLRGSLSLAPVPQGSSKVDF